MNLITILQKISRKTGLMHTSFQRFALVCHARTGSNYLRDGINTISAVKMYHEIYAEHNRELGKDFEIIYNRYFNKVEYFVSRVGCKLFYYHLTEDEWNKFMLYPFKYIHLTRDNKLKTIISLDKAFRTDQWVNNENNSNNTLRLKINTDNLIQRIEGIEKYENEFRQRVKGKPVLEIVYEHVVEHPAEDFHMISDFLEIPDIDHTLIKLRKQSKNNLQEEIENYYDVKSLLENSPYSRYLISG